MHLHCASFCILPLNYAGLIPCKGIRRQPAGTTIYLSIFCLFVQVFDLVKNGSSRGFDIHSRHCYDFRVLSKRGNCRHPIFDRPQDLGITDGLLGVERCAGQRFNSFGKERGKPFKTLCLGVWSWRKEERRGENRLEKKFAMNPGRRKSNGTRWIRLIQLHTWS